MRIRTTASPLCAVSQSGDFQVNGSHYATFGPYTWHYTALYERIEDWLGGRWLGGGLGGRVLKYKPCYHERWAYEPNLASPWSKITSNSGIFINPNAQMIGWGLRNASWDAGSQLAGLFRDIPGPVTQHFTAGWLACKPSMVNRANMSVFLYELGDIRRMFNVLPGKHLKNMQSWSDVLASVARYGNGLHLNYNFGWKPFVSDCKSVVKAVRSFDTRLAKFVGNANRQLTRRHVVPDVSHTGEIADVSEPDGWFFLQPYSGTAKFTSCFGMSYTVPEYSPNEMRFRAWADALGLRLTAANVWAVLPWSFVVDWFVDIGSYLEQYSTDWLQPWVSLSQACCTLTWDVTGKRIRYGPFSSDRCPSLAGTVTFHKFFRHVGAPYSGLTAGDLNADRIRLLASLIGARF